MSDTDKLKLTIVRDECIGDGACCADAPNTFELDDDGIAVVKDRPWDDRDAVLHAARCCPTDAIIVVDTESGAQLVPER